MSSNDDTLWKIEPHTKTKHEILRKYLGAWFAILGSQVTRIMYIDGFCGPGKYSGGEDGSPIIALQEAINQPRLSTGDVIFLFNDGRSDRIKHLQSILDRIKVPSNFHISCIENEFENTLVEILDNQSRNGQHLPPTFAFIDPFGFKGAPFY